MFSSTVKLSILYFLILYVRFLTKALVLTANFEKNNHFIRSGVELQTNDLEKTHDVIFAVKYRNLEALEKILHELSDPFHESYGKHLSREEVQALTSNNDGRAIILEYFNLHGIQVVKQTLYGDFITARTTISSWEKLLSAKFIKFHHINDYNYQIFRVESYSIDEALLQHISATFNLVNLPLPKLPVTPITMEVKAASETSYISPATLNKYYNIFTNTGDASITQTVYSAIGQYFSSVDLASFQSYFSIPSHPMDADPNFRNSNDQCIANSNNCAESNLDIQYITAIAQATNSTIIYDSINDAFVSWITSVANTAKPAAVYSISYFILESDLTAYLDYVTEFNTQAMILGVMGTTIVAATGDDGAPGYKSRDSSNACAYDPGFPATSPYVLAVGATMGVEVTNGFEVSCDASLGGVITSGGGFSTIIPAPLHQSRAISGYFSSVSKSGKMPVSGYSITGRGIPDVSLAGKSYVTVIGGKFFSQSGTSASAPVVAAMISLINAARMRKGKSTLGWFNPALYAYNGTFTNDIISGNNLCTENVCCSQGYYTSPGWDPVTGFGSVDFTGLYNLFSGAVTSPSTALTRSPAQFKSRSPTRYPVVPMPTATPFKSTSQDSVMCTLAAALSPATAGYKGWLCSTGSSPTPTTTVCTWGGLSCDDNSNSVIKINLDYLLTGSIPSGIGAIGSLTHLSITYSKIVGTLPTSIGSLIKLSYLSLQHTLLTGSLPSSMSQLIKLQELYLAHNFFTGIIPTDFSKLVDIQYFSVSRNKFSGLFPAIALEGLVSLVSLEMTDNWFTGSLPSTATFWSNPLLNIFDVSNNYLIGSLPTAMGLATAMRHLNIGYNLLSGRIPSHLSTLSGFLSYLDLSNNVLSGTIPNYLHEMSALRILLLNNNQINGTIPTTGTVTVNPNSTEPTSCVTAIEYLDCSDNLITGTIPPHLGIFSETAEVYFHGNKLIGTIPSTLRHNPQLSSLGLGDNLNGTVPKALLNSTALKGLFLYGNALSGAFFDNIANFGNLESLVLYSDCLKGSIPSSLSLLSQLTFLGLGRGLTGSLSPVVTRLTKLMGLELQSNSLSGMLPKDLTKLVLLEQLSLSSNQFNGSLSSLFKDNFLSLQYLDLSHNSFNDTLPSFINQSSLINLNLQNNHFTGSVSSSLCSFSNLDSIDVRNNPLYCYASCLSGVHFHNFSGIDPCPETIVNAEIIKEKHNNNSQTTAIIIGCVVGGVALIVIIIVAIVFLFRGSNEKKENSKLEMI